LSLEPIQHIGIDARGDLALARAIEVAPPGVLPLFFRHFGISLVSISLSGRAASAFNFARRAFVNGAACPVCS